ncbi:OmpA family protein [Aureibaculum sp. 2210JD6-5]|uniref:OmpA family protein n=1 Tax=Aureibaculum sp. 2210JD6-5 TaxID=3103957 RepID=UPI002AAD3934|nr:OmpA family protein [Aureibaculum sp. 2210JD6-5]MDY7395989.1 OmpA family protein [Aureibaculum sp. 2210JD6-5]
MRSLIILIFVLSTVFSNAQIERADSIKAAEYSIKNLEVNTKYQDFGSTFMGKDKIVFSSSRKTAGLSNRKWKKNDQPFLNLYIGDLKSNGEIVNVKPFSSDVNSKYHDAFVAFTPDLKEVYFTSNNYMGGKLKSEGLKIFKATVDKKGHWKDFSSLPFNDDDYDTGHPMISADGSKLYFVSNMPGTLGDTDIFVVDLNQGHYGKIINLGETINSKYKEYSPYVDGDVIYFSSNRPGGKGGFDIYMTKLDGSIPEPINLGEPMNSKGDDISFIIDSDKLQGYFSSNRNGGMGDDDIYSFKQKTTIAICDQIATGIIKDKVTGNRVGNAFVALIDENGNRIRRIETAFDGEYYFGVDCASNYTLEVTKNGYFSTSVDLETSNKNGFDNNEVIFIEEKEFMDRKDYEILNVPNITFTINTAEITESSERALDKVMRLMKKYPNMVIEFGAHTDSRGPDAYNLSLTKSRATAVVNNLLERGLDHRRITGKGYGETQPLNKCVNNVPCTDLEYLENKRTEFVVIKK